MATIPNLDIPPDPADPLHHDLSPLSRRHALIHAASFTFGTNTATVVLYRKAPHGVVEWSWCLRSQLIAATSEMGGGWDVFVTLDRF